MGPRTVSLAASAELNVFLWYLMKCVLWWYLNKSCSIFDAEMCWAIVSPWCSRVWNAKRSWSNQIGWMGSKQVSNFWSNKQLKIKNKNRNDRMTCLNKIIWNKAKNLRNQLEFHVWFSYILMTSPSNIQQFWVAHTQQQKQISPRLFGNPGHRGQPHALGGH